jgi:hypothetical protein
VISSTEPTHEGPCHVNLDLGIGGTGLTPRDLAERAMLWTEGLDEFDDIRPLARMVLDSRRGDLEIDRTHFDALVEIITEFGEYAGTCGYDTDEDEEDRRIAQCLIRPESRQATTWVFCDRPVTWTETWPPRWSWETEPRIIERKAGAHT